MGANADAETREARMAVAVHGEIDTVAWEGYKALVLVVDTTITVALGLDERHGRLLESKICETSATQALSRPAACINR